MLFLEYIFGKAKCSVDFVNRENEPVIREKKVLEF